MADLSAWVPATLTLIGGGGFAWVFKLRRQNDSTAVATAENALLLMQELNKTILDTLERSNKSNDRLERENEILLVELRDCTQGCHELRLELRKSRGQ